LTHLSLHTTHTARPSDIHDHTAFTGNPVQEARLADIRATDDRDTHLSGVRLELFRRRWQLRDDRVEEVPGRGALEPGDGEEIAEAELVEFRRLRLGAP